MTRATRILADRYRLVEKVGEGGMSVVWRAHDAWLERDVAIKLLRPFVADEPSQRRRFAREARTLAALSNDHIVRVFDYVQDGDDAFLVMEFIEGRSLARATFARLPLSWQEASSYARAVCDALAYAHAKGVIHRDLTPSNILVESDSGRVVTTDFGLARIARGSGSATTIGTLLGTPEYWAPEQALGRETDAAADMYALGCILFQLLSGRLPFVGEDRLAVGLRRAHEDAPSLREHAPSTPGHAVSLVDTLLCRDPSRRPDARAAANAILDLHAPPTLRLTRDDVWPERVDPPTIALPATHAAARATVRVAPKRERRRRRRWTLPALGLTFGVLAGVLAAAHFVDRGPRTPDVVSLGERAARAQILQTMPTASVSVVRAYSTRVGRGRVIRQRPEARSHLDIGAKVTLVVSKGTPYAVLPMFIAGTTPENAKAYLERNGFDVRYRWTPSWSVRKGTVIELHPGSGMRVRRPATVRVVVSSGWPRAVVPDVQSLDVDAAKRELEAKHLRYGIVKRPAYGDTPGLVASQKPAAGATVYEGTRVWLAVPRLRRWTQVLADTGSGEYESAPFTVARKWRIRYRIYGDADVSWTRDGDFFSDGGFSASGDGALHTYTVSGDPGTFSVNIRPYGDNAAWDVEVYALR